MKGDLISQSLSKIPLENGRGEALQLCPKCFGRGVYHAARNDCGLPNGKKYKAGHPLTDGEVKLFKKQGWGFDGGDCTQCGGAGMAKVSHG